MNFPGKNYTAYLLRLWQTKDNHSRIILQNVHTGEQECFGSINDLFTFIANHHSNTGKDQTSAPDS